MSGCPGLAGVAAAGPQLPHHRRGQEPEPDEVRDQPEQPGLDYKVEPERVHRLGREAVLVEPDRIEPRVLVPVRVVLVGDDAAELTDAVTEQRATYQQLLALLVVEQSDLPVGHGAGVLRVRDLRRGAPGAARRVHSRGATGEAALPLGQGALREDRTSV